MRLNGSVLNGAPLNGAQLAYHEGSASIDTSAVVSATGVRIVNAGATLVCTAGLVADAFRTVAPEALFTCTGSLYAAQTHVQAGGAEIHGTADVVAYVLRQVDASAQFDCTASINAVCDGQFGAAAITGTAAITADSTRIIPGGIAGPFGTAEFTAAALPIRMATAPIDCSATLRAEASTKVSGESFYRHDGYADVLGTAGIAAGATVTKLPSAAITATATLTSSGTQIQPGAANMGGSGVLALGSNVFVMVVPTAGITGTATVSASATRTVAAGAAFVGAADIAPSARQQHASAVVIDATALFAAQGTRVVMAESQTAAGTCEVVAFAHAIEPGAASLTGTATVSADIAFFPRTMAGASFDCAADIEANLHGQMAGVAAIIGTAQVIAVPRTNADADDPEERTMRRPFVDTTMRREFVDTEMRRAA